VKATNALGLLLLIVVFLFEFLKDEVNTNQLWSLMILVAITALFILFSRKQQSKYYSAFWVEALPILWAAVLMVLT
ncbi:MAG: hypothetical protein KJO96_10325, partial [Winogradskyella sp.]|nr:hypothetical protein [Winogradskyella sp.]